MKSSSQIRRQRQKFFSPSIPECGERSLHRLSGFWRLRQISLSVLLLALSLSLAGCYAGPSFNKAFDSNGIPKHQYLVGGGFEIEYVAPADGTAYWVEETTQKILETKSLNSGDKAKFGGVGADPDQIKQLFGIELKDVKFTLYFVPD